MRGKVVSPNTQGGMNMKSKSERLIFPIFLGLLGIVWVNHHDNQMADAGECRRDRT